MSGSGTDLAADLKAFARAHVAPHADRLIRQTDYPADIWQALGQAGHLGYGLGRHGGLDVSPVEMFDLAEAFADGGEVPGMTMLWMGHHAIAGKIIQAYASASQADIWLPRLARGELSAAIAISEPGAGAQPKAMSATASRRDDGQWVLNGSKAWLTNGPAAGLFVFVAITEVVDGRKRFGAFLVPDGVEGLSREPGFEIDYAHPCGHCTLVLKDVVVPDDAWMEEAGDALETVLKRFRRVEDLVGLATAAGGMAAELRRLTAILPDSAATDLGRLAGERELVRSAGRQLMADCNGDPAAPEHEARLLALRAVSRQFQAGVAELIASADRTDDFLNLLSRDLSQLGRIAQRIDQAKMARTGANMLRRSVS